MEVHAVTAGIEVAVLPSYEGKFFSRQGSLYLFKYHVTIKNKSDRTVQLLGRHWFIFDTGEGTSEVEGEGVVGEQPILYPGATHHYESGCQLRSSIGAMEGYYKMIDLQTQKNFQVQIPTFQFFATPRLN
jgi:ApaG protein